MSKPVPESSPKPDEKEAWKIPDAFDEVASGLYMALTEYEKGHGFIFTQEQVDDVCRQMGDVERAQGYFVWSKAVVDACRGTNAQLEAQLDDVFAGYLHVPWSTGCPCSAGAVALYECIPQKEDLPMLVGTLLC